MEPPGQMPEEVENHSTLQQEQHLDQGIQQDEPVNNTSETGTRGLTESVPTRRSTSPLSDSESTSTPAAMPRLLLLHGADTLVFIDPSPETVRAKVLLPAPTVPHRIHSERLLTTGSAYFRRLYSPRMQTRVRKRRGLLGELPDGIQYVLDLTPPMLDEDAVIFLTELSCPMNIRTWASQRKLWNLPRSCVGGQDELELSERLTKDPTTSLVSDADAYSSSSEDSCEEQDTFFRRTQSLILRASPPKIAEQEHLPVEYSASRHREGIEHILHVLEGLHTSIDTPCKLWTFFALAKIFDVASAPVICDKTISWFYQLNNVRFIELHPDITYRVACGIRSPSLCRDSFIAMVGDEALLYLIRSTGFQPAQSMEISLRSRMPGDLDDTEVQRIEYASKSFGDYIVRCFLHLSGSKMSWLAQVAEFQKLTRHLDRYPQDQDIVQQFTRTLKEFIRDRIYGILATVRDTNRSFHVLPTLVASKNPYCLEWVQKDFLVQRLLGKSFWRALISLDLCATQPFRPVSHASIAELGRESSAFSGETAASICHVSAGEVRQMSYRFNQVVRTRLRARQEEEALAAEFAGSHVVMKLTLNPSQSHTKEVGSNPNSGPFVNPVPAPLPNPCVVPTSSVLADSEFPDDMFNEMTFIAEVHCFLRQYAQQMLQPPSPTTIQHELTDILTCLTYNEFQYLPLWAGGNDDGTGGVFTDLIIPAMDIGGFSGPGPAVHTGSVASTNGSFSEIDASDSRSTVQAASRNATYSHMSDLLSVSSVNYSQASAHAESRNEPQSEIDIEDNEYDDEIALALAVMTDNEEYGTQSDDTITDTMSLPSSSADIAGDIDMDIMNDEENGTGFELVDFHNI